MITLASPLTGSFLAYIGPGAGFAFFGSFLVLFAALLLSFLLLMTLPIRLLWRALFIRARRGRYQRCVILGFDGMDPRRAATLMDNGELPHLARLRQDGVFSALGSTCPPISPVAWSTFLTGVNPGKHNIFDFVNRNLQTYLPELSLARVHTQRRGFRVAGKHPKNVELLRKSQPFWNILGRHGVFSTILRVPATFPCEPFNGLALASLGIPDLRGCQGEYTLFETSTGATTANADDPSTEKGGKHITVERSGNLIRCILPGPVANNRARHLQCKVRVQGNTHVLLYLDGRRYCLTVNVDSPWIPVRFRAGWKRISGVCRFRLLSVEPQFRLYVTPLHIDPEHPAMPISHPSVYSVYLAKRLGPFATLGQAEDTTAFTDGVLDGDAFLNQCHDIHDERERMFLGALERTRRGLCVCVFDLTDRLQHMFYRCNDPARPPDQTRANHHDEPHTTAIDDAYRRCDRLVGETLRRLDEKSLLLVVSDHGFCSFRREVNLNAWLREQGYLVLREDVPADTDCLGTVDWSRTRAYGLGLSGIYINQQGREACGVVAPGDEAQRLRTELRDQLTALCDSRSDGASVVRQIYEAATTYNGPYTDNAPDLVVGFRAGYRVSWKSAMGRTDGPVFTDNTKAWSGDHCVDRAEVPGVLFANRPLQWIGRQPHLSDIAPTLLRLWNIDVPAYMDGTAMEVKDAETTQ